MAPERAATNDGAQQLDGDLVLEERDQQRALGAAEGGRDAPEGHEVRPLDARQGRAVDAVDARDFVRVHDEGARQLAGDLAPHEPGARKRIRG